MENTLPKCLQEWIYRQDERVSRAKALAPHAEAAQTACQLAGIGEVYFSDITFGINVMVRNAATFDECVPLLRELAKLGYHTNKSMPFVDHADLNFRSYKVGPIDVDVHLKLDGAMCRKVQVGVKEEPVYEFVCD